MDRFSVVAHHLEERMLWHNLFAGAALVGLALSAAIVSASASSLHHFVVAAQHFVTRC